MLFKPKASVCKQPLCKRSCIPCLDSESENRQQKKEMLVELSARFQGSLPERMKQKPPDPASTYSRCSTKSDRQESGKRGWERAWNPGGSVAPQACNSDLWNSNSLGISIFAYIDTGVHLEPHERQQIVFQTFCLPKEKEQIPKNLSFDLIKILKTGPSSLSSSPGTHM